MKDETGDWASIGLQEVRQNLLLQLMKGQITKYRFEIPQTLKKNLMNR